MPPKDELITVYRSMDAEAKEDAENILELVNRCRAFKRPCWMTPRPVCRKAFSKCRCPPRDAARAEELIAENPPPEEAEEVDDSSALDLEAVASATSEMEAMSIRNLLESNDIATVLVGDSVLPNFPFEVRVARDQADRARILIADAEKGGPAAAEEAERASESGS